MKSTSFQIPAVEISLKLKVGLGFGFHWIWVFCILFGMGRILGITEGAISQRLLAEFTALNFCGICLAFLVLGMIGHKLKSFITDKKVAFFSIIGAVMTMALLATVQFVSDDVTLRAVGCVSGFCAGVASGYLLLAWGLVYRSLDSFSVSVNAAIGLIVAVFIYNIVLWCGAIVVLFVVSVPAMVIEGVLCALAQKEGLSGQDVSVSDDHAEMQSALSSKASLTRTALLLVIFGFVTSILRELALSSFRATQDLPHLLIDACIMIVIFAAFFLVVYVILDQKIQDRTNYSFVTVLTIGVAVVALFFMNVSDGLAYQIVCVVTYLVFEVYVWTWFAQTSKESKASVTAIYGLGLLFLFFGQFLSPITNGFVTSLAQPLQLENVTEPVILMFALMIVVVLLAIDKSDKRQSKMEAVPLITEDTLLTKKLTDVEKCYLLTEREGEILSMLVRGRSFAKISEVLYISENTTKTHVKNIYRKTNVHSRQELMDIVESWAQD